LKKLNILDERHKILYKKSIEVEFPLSKEEKKIIKEMLKYLRNSQIEEIATKENLRPGMGLSAVQLGHLKRYFVIVEELKRKENEPQIFKDYIIINPKITSYSEEQIYVEEGEGCLSVNRDVEGIVLRNARITLEYYDIEGNKNTLRARDELSIAIQHEIDHLNGILFFQKIEKNPIKNTTRCI